ncbi:MAG: hypothetical protein Q8M40_09720 [Legionella sp.]|nr:hypothetical protein [Legionella sp.]
MTIENSDTNNQDQNTATEEKKDPMLQYLEELRHMVSSSFGLTAGNSLEATTSSNDTNEKEAKPNQEAEPNQPDRAAKQPAETQTATLSPMPDAPTPTSLLSNIQFGPKPQASKDQEEPENTHSNQLTSA